MEELKINSIVKARDPNGNISYGEYTGIGLDGMHYVSFYNGYVKKFENTDKIIPSKDERKYKKRTIGLQR